jgi:hypothetical protein
MIDINWGALALVTGTTLVAAVVIVTLYALGMRLLAVGPDAAHRPPIATVGAWVCIGIGALAVLYGIYLVIPIFH